MEMSPGFWDGSVAAGRKDGLMDSLCGFQMMGLPNILTATNMTTSRNDCVCLKIAYPFWGVKTRIASGIGLGVILAHHASVTGSEQTSN